MVFVRAFLVLFVLAWIFDVLGVRGMVPVWVPFALALGLELQLFIAGWLRAPGPASRGRVPQEGDRERFGYEGEELLLVRDGERELWIPYSGETGEFVGAVQHADGVAEVGGRVAYLTPERCYDLYRLALRGEVSFSQTGRAIAVLAHEAWHLRGERDEGRTECFALQSGVELGERLGLPEETARQMMRQQLTENQLRARGALEYLVSPDCRD